MSAWSERTPRERKLVMAFAAVVVLGGGMKVMAAGGAEPVVVESVPLKPATAMPATPGEPAVVPPDDAPAAGDLVHPTGPGSKRDPFEPRVSLTGKASGSTGGGGAGGGSTDNAADGSVTITLEDIYPDGEGRLMAILKVDGSRFRSRAGGSVAKLVLVSHLDDRCGVFEHADGTFGLCVGQTIERSR